MSRLWIHLLLLLGFCNTVRAAEIAVLDFDSFGMTHDDASLISQGFRDAFLEEGRFFPLEGYDISDRLGMGREADLSQARSLVGDARTKLNAGQATQAIEILHEAERLHLSAGSHVARRAQLSDVYFFMGQAQLRMNQSREAHASFVKMLQTYPGYLETRAGNVSSGVSRAVEKAKAERAQRDRELLDVAAVQAISRRLQVPALVVGVVDSNGQLKVRFFQNGRIQGEIQRVLQDMPPFPGDPVYLDMIKELTLNATAVGSSRGSFQEPPSFGGQNTSSGSSGQGGFDQPNFDAPPPVADGQDEQRDSTPLPDSIGKERTDWWKFWKNWSRPTRPPATGQINVGGRSHLPVTQRWWFWGATGAIVVGGGVTAAVLLVQSDGPDGPRDGPTYNIVIDSE